MSFPAALGTFAGDFTQHSLVFLHFVTLMSPLHHHPLILLPQHSSLVFLFRVNNWWKSARQPTEPSTNGRRSPNQGRCSYHQTDNMDPDGPQQNATESRGDPTSPCLRERRGKVTKGEHAEERERKYFGRGTGVPG